MLVAMLPGSFDPPTNGHLNLIHRASAIFDKVYLVIAVNRSKEYLLTGDERLELMKNLLKDCKNVEVRIWDRLIVDFARETGARVIIRGVRALADFGYEFELAMTYKSLSPEIDTIFMPTDPKYFVLRSSAIKEIAMLGGDITTMVPKPVAELLIRRMNGKKE
ncbi:MAG: pantetheine-phosphate adenylyltransferase [Spirochaetales bacterium]|nr:pantetheine-phosphate adenylyltransferase [Spirochaetales bacterium]